MDKPDGPIDFASRASPGRRFLQASIGYLLGAACLIWVLREVHPRELVRSMTNIHWWWVALAMLFDVLSYLCQGWRWELLLRPVGRVGVLRATQAVYAGLFANEILPMRAGELIRSYLVSRWIPARFSAVFPSVVVERLFDGVWLALCIGVTAIYVPLPKNLLEAGDILGAVVLIGTGLFLYLVYRRRKEVPAPAGTEPVRWKPLRLLRSFLVHLEAGIRAIGTSKSFYAAFAVSPTVLAGQILAFWFIMLAYGFSLSVWVGTVVLLIVHLGTAIPNAPANVGTYQFFVFVGLTLFGVEKTAAAGFSLVVFVLLTIPLWAIGLAALGRTGMSLSTIRKEIKRLAQ